MASNSVMKAAIKQLEEYNYVLETKKAKGNCNIEEIDKQIAKNDAMILDYNYRINNNKG